MSRLRARRFTTIVMVVVAVLFAQMALAQYVCPLADLADGQPMAMEMAPGVQCDSMESHSDAPALCQHHCTNAAQSFDPVKVPSVTLPAVVQVLVVPLRIDATQRQAVMLAAQGQAQPPPSPVFLSTLRLRV